MLYAIKSFFLLLFVICYLLFANSVSAQEQSSDLLPEAIFFSNKEAQEALTPYGEKAPTAESPIACFFGACGRRVQETFLPAGEITERPAEDLAEKLLSWLFGAFVGKSGALHSINPAEAPCTQEVNILGLKKCKDAFAKSLEPAIGVSASIANSTPFQQVNAENMKELIKTVSGSQCVPPALILAIAHTEGQAFSKYTEEDVTFFSGDGWWKSATREQIERGYCFDTCKRQGLYCLPVDNVMGPTQFNLNTWKGILPQIRSAAQTLFGRDVTDDKHERCNLQNAVIATAVKIKQDSKTSATECLNWSEDIVRKVALPYHGSTCKRPNGTNYCEDVVRTYRLHSNSNQP